MCEHEWHRFLISFLGMRWQCVKCDKIAPACFEPIEAVVRKVMP